MKRLTGTTEEISKILYQEQLELSKENLDVDDAVRQILEDVKENGDKALKAYSEKFDKIVLDDFAVGQAIAGAATKEGAKGFEAIPISMYNMKWDKFLGIVYEARGMHNRKIVGIPPFMMKLGMYGIVKDYKKRGIDSGMDPLQLPYIMDYDLFITDKYTRDLGVEDDDIEAAITDSIKVSQESYEGKVKLLDMKGE